MKTIGIVGGIAPESSVEYYRLFQAGYKARVGDGSYPHLLLYSIDMKKMLDLIAAEHFTQTAEYLAAAVKSLAQAGAAVGLLASNTPHIVFDQVAERSPIPLVSIVDAACAAARKRGLRRVGLFGTRSTVQSRFYPEAFMRNAIDVLRPAPDEINFIHDKYMGELVKGVYLPETRQAMLDIIARFKERNTLDGIILGGTELPLLFRADSAHGLPLLDTTRIHVDAVLQAAFSA